MIEVFAGTAVLSSVAKQFGLVTSLAIDKVKKRGARSTIFSWTLRVSVISAYLNSGCSLLC